MAQKLALSTLPKLNDAVAVPGYSRADLTAGIVHIGIGNFHRAHQAFYLHKLFETGRDHDWALVGAGVKHFDADKRALLEQQDWLTTVMELSPEGYTASVTGAMIDFCDVNAAATIAQLSDPAIRIVSLTITEGGYFVDAKTGGFDTSHPEIQTDATAPETPVTVFGLILAALQNRRAAGVPPFTVLSCDNLPENGDIAKQATIGLATLQSADFGAWVAQNISFPNTMVDCITPATSQREIDMVADKFGINDLAPVACEPFRQWVMEDKFPQGRPALETVGVSFVDDIMPFETMKLRILNAGHATIAYPAALLGIEFVHDAMADEDIVAWLTKLMRSEVMPVLPEVKGVSFEDYLQTCITRFANPEIGDTITRLCNDGSNRQPKFVLPTIEDAIAANTDLDGLALEVAFWCAYCASAGSDSSVALNDERETRLIEAATNAATDPAAFLALTDVFGDIGQDARFVKAFSAQLTRLNATGPRETLRSYLAS